MISSPCFCEAETCGFSATNVRPTGRKAEFASAKDSSLRTSTIRLQSGGSCAKGLSLVLQCDNDTRSLISRYNPIQYSTSKGKWSSVKDSGLCSGDEGDGEGKERRDGGVVGSICVLYVPIRLMRYAGSNEKRLSRSHSFVGDGLHGGDRCIYREQIAEPHFAGAESLPFSIHSCLCLHGSLLNACMVSFLQIQGFQQLGSPMAANATWYKSGCLSFSQGCLGTG
jgi:hypothetical protein